MCGLTGFFAPGHLNHAEATALVMRMRDTLVHRRPDRRGPLAKCRCGHRYGPSSARYTLDLSPAGDQPMVSTTGRYVLVFNGEIYNHREIRRSLEASQHLETDWRGHSDTETLLAAIEAWSLPRALQRCVGMFALALWDRQDQLLSLARDRMGEKAAVLYGSRTSGTLLFGSELEALRAHPNFCAEIDRDVLPLYLRHGYVPESMVDCPEYPQINAGLCGAVHQC